MRTESRYGICFGFDLAFEFSASADITVPNVSNERFMLQPSFKRSPSLPVFETFSLPARSIRLSLLTFSPEILKIGLNKILLQYK